MDAERSTSGSKEGLWERAESYARAVDKLLSPDRQRLLDAHQQFAQLAEPARKAMEAWHRNKPPSWFAEAAERASKEFERFRPRLTELPEFGHDMAQWSCSIDGFGGSAAQSEVLQASRLLHEQVRPALELQDSLRAQITRAVPGSSEVTRGLTCWLPGTGRRGPPCPLDLRDLVQAFQRIPWRDYGSARTPPPVDQRDRARPAPCDAPVLQRLTPAPPAGTEPRPAAAGNEPAVSVSAETRTPVPPPSSCVALGQVRPCDWVTMKEALRTLQEAGDRQMSKSTLRRRVLRDGLIRGVWDPDPRRKRKHLVGVMLDSLRNYNFQLDDREVDASPPRTIRRRPEPRR